MILSVRALPAALWLGLGKRDACGPSFLMRFTGSCVSLVQVLTMSPETSWAQLWVVEDALELGAGEANFLGLCLL